MFRASTRGSSFVGVARDASGLEDELLLVPVVVVDVGAVEALDHFGGAGAGFNDLEDAEGDECTAIFVVQAVRVDDEGGSPARGSLPGGLAATLVRGLSLFENDSPQLTGKILIKLVSSGERCSHALLDRNQP